MIQKRIYLIRHGETDFNKKRVVQGSGIDASLNETGREQADRFFQAYKGVQFDKVYTSVLKRSIESVDGFLKMGLAHEKLEGLNEINWGNREGTEMTVEENEYYLEMLKTWQSGKTNIAIEGGESPDDVQIRVRSAMELIISNHDEKTILICMHGRAIRILLATLMNYPLSKMDVFEHKNLGLYELVYTGTMYQIEKFNNTDHLTDTTLI